MLPGRTLRKAAPAAAPAGREAAVAECALELTRIGDRWHLRQRILNMIAKLFCPETWAARGDGERNRRGPWLCGFGRRGSTDSGR
ncbi:PREDICTED: phorbol-12-myristate-13-acetate-induced protein 1 [Pseudopodoces humilis]|uniref:phorbol-12-myristate-13-acetate-induced protein 1 n=1 Tax=Pseudopodoces humilis TaxID=181119 RepID=UPI000395C20A|nr:PREDICTED: phorbol-12-myristate-13-acetate-induced protein 1 [Pseudopodoces humilis]